VRCAILACALLATSGCYWGKTPLDHPIPINRRYPVWIWSGDSAVKWHAVRLTEDSVSGIPFRLSVKCDTCRRSMPRSHVDSMTLRYKTGLQMVTEITGAVIGLTLVDGGVCMLVAPHDAQC